MYQNTASYELFRIAGPKGQLMGAFMFSYEGADLRVIISNDGGWDHVSVSLVDRCPTWDEMCYIKDIFFKPSETVIQFHPPKSQYINDHEFCLHLWRCQDAEFPLPPASMVGFTDDMDDKERDRVRAKMQLLFGDRSQGA